MLLNSLGNTHYPIWGDSIHGQGDFLEGATIPRSQIEWNEVIEKDPLEC